MALDAYEQVAFNEIEAWYVQQLRETSKPLHAANKWLGGGVNKALSLPGPRSVLKFLEPVMTGGLAGVAKTVSLPEISAVYQLHGVNDLGDIRQLSLQVPDDETRHIGRKYAGLAVAEGAAMGAAALVPGVGNLAAVGLIGADVVAVTGIGMRLLCDYAAHYGYDPTDEREQLFIQGVLGLVGALDSVEKAALLRELRVVAVEISKKAAWAQLRQHASVRVIEAASKKAGVKLIKRQLGVVIPVVGAGVGAGANGWFIKQLDDEASHAFRRRFLAEKQIGPLIEG